MSLLELNLLKPVYLFSSNCTIVIGYRLRCLVILEEVPHILLIMTEWCHVSYIHSLHGCPYVWLSLFFYDMIQYRYSQKDTDTDMIPLTFKCPYICLPLHLLALTFAYPYLWVFLLYLDLLLHWLAFTFICAYLFLFIY